MLGADVQQPEPLGAIGVDHDSRNPPHEALMAQAARTGWVYESFIGHEDHPLGGGVCRRAGLW
jgi:hypothetical protein